MSAWFEKFFKGLYIRVLASQHDAKATAEQVRVVKRVLRLRKGDRVLDIPCGMGRLTIPMAKMGLRMTGVDLTSEYVRRARMAAKRAGVKAEFVCCDMRDIGFEGEFDAAFNWFGSFGYFSDADNLAFCRRIYAALKPGGRFLVEGLNKSSLLSHFRPKDGYTVGGVDVAIRCRWDKKTSRTRCRWTLRRGRKTERHTIVMRVFNGTELRNFLRAAGFHDVALYGRPFDKPFSRHSRRVLAVGVKPR